jgi:hypothetical protein
MSRFLLDPPDVEPGEAQYTFWCSLAKYGPDVVLSTLPGFHKLPDYSQRRFQGRTWAQISAEYFGDQGDYEDERISGTGKYRYRRATQSGFRWRRFRKVTHYRRGKYRVVRRTRPI